MEAGAAGKAASRAAGRAVRKSDDTPISSTGKRTSSASRFNMSAVSALASDANVESASNALIMAEVVVLSSAWSTSYVSCVRMRLSAKYSATAVAVPAAINSEVRAMESDHAADTLCTVDNSTGSAV